MRILIDLTPLYKRKKTGVEMYAIDFYRALCKTHHTIIPIFHGMNELDNNVNAVIIPQNNRYILETFSLPKVIHSINADIALFPIFPPSFKCYNTKTKIIPTLHDFAFIEFKETLSWKARLYLTPRYMFMFKKAYGIITISETIKRKLSEYTSKKVWNCGENISEEYKVKSIKDASHLTKWNILPYNYIISVSTIEPRKNLKYLLNIVQEPLLNSNFKIVLVGRKGWGIDENLKSLIEKLGDKLIFTDYITTEELIMLYHYAYSFALLSLDEGFGRTPFEAVACGCKRVILSDIPIFRETFDGNATFLPLNDIKIASQKLDFNKLISVDKNFSLPFDVMEERISEVLKSIEQSTNI